MRQNIIGKEERSSKIYSIYLEESHKIWVFTILDTALLYPVSELEQSSYQWVLGLAQGMFTLLIFDLKVISRYLAYSPDIIRTTQMSILRSMVVEVGLRIGVALKF